METTKTEIEMPGMGISLVVRGKYMDTVQGFPHEKNDHGYRNKFNILIRNVHTGASFGSAFYGSIPDCQNGITELDRAALLSAVDCIVSDAIYGAYSFEDFCQELGYGEDPRKAERIHRAVQKTLRGWERIGISQDDLYSISAYIQKEMD